MRLADIVADYVEFKLALGMRFRAEIVILAAFCRALGDVDLEEVEPHSVRCFIDGQGPLTTFWHRKFEALAGFYRFVIGRGYVARSPLPKTVPKRPKAFVPYIYTVDEMRRLLAAATTLQTPRCILHADTFRALLLVLYGTGLRIGEALRLTWADVDISGGLLTIHCSKFFKSRLVPTGPQLTEVLHGYAYRRRPRLKREGSVFFATCQGAAISRGYVEKNFRKLCDQADVRRNDGARYQPRLHDMRHTFAVNRLVTWYREGADVQRLLPHLSTYLGHLNLGATQRYLTMTPELLREASCRFERYALPEVNRA